MYVYILLLNFTIALCPVLVDMFLSKGATNKLVVHQVQGIHCTNEKTQYLITWDGASERNLLWNKQARQVCA